MIKIIYTIFDEKSGLYSDPYTAINIATAERDFTYACTKDTATHLYRHRMDMHLIKLAEYDDEQGVFTISRQLLISGSQLISQAQE